MEQISEVGPYRIDREIGRGGMGVVYLAHDSRLDRAVAIKALPDHLAADPDRLARFEREARSLATLNHPNIAGIYAIEQHENHKYLVLEYVEGETLAERLQRGPLSIHDTIEIATHVAAGVEAAHNAGFVHRDLKPANIKLTPQGKAVVLDFGLAKASEALSNSSSSFTSAGTLTTPHAPTVPGTILGTAPYMSPEQARGKPLDKRSDIWSFGVILYECLTGTSPFVGETVGDSIGAILHKDVDLDRLPPGTPQPVVRLLRRCLQRDRNKRLRDIGDARVELEEALGAPAPPGSSTPATSPSHAIPLAIGALIGIALGAAATWGLLATQRPSPSSIAPPPPRRYTITLPTDAPIAPPSAYPFGIARSSFALSRDGSMMVYTALVDGQKQLCVRDMATGEVRPVPGGLDGFGAVFSPDGREIAFFANERLWRMDIAGRTDPELLGVTSSPAGAAWAPDGSIYFSPAEMTPIYCTPPGSTDATVATILSRGTSHNGPRLSLGGRALLFTEFTGLSNVLITTTDASVPQHLLVEFADSALITPSGHLLFGRENRLMAASIDTPTLNVRGEPVTVLSNLRSSWNSAQYDISDDGTLVYIPGIQDETARFVWLDRSGEANPLNLGLQRFVAFALSPDAQTLVTPITEGRDTDIWVYDLDRPQTPARLTFGGVHNNCIWSRDGRFILFGKYTADGGSSILAKNIQSGAPPFVIYQADTDAAPRDYDSTTGELLFMLTQEGTGADLMRGAVDLSMGEGATLDHIQTVRGTRYGEPFAAISPDRNWLVAVSDETGRWELYLASYPELGGSRLQISTGGGEEPRWTEDGSRILYRWNNTWYEVDVTIEPRLSVSPPRVIASGPYINVPGYSWDMTADGQRLLLLEGPQQDTPVTELQVVTYFFSEMSRRLPKPAR